MSAVARLGTVVRWLLALAALGASVAGAAWVLLALDPARQLGGRAVVMFASFIPYGTLAWLFVAVVLLVIGRRRWRLLALPAAALLILQASWTTPYWPGAAPSPTGEPFRLVSLNMRYGKADAQQLARHLAETRPDVVVLLEYSDAAEEQLSAAGVLAGYPHRVGTSVPGWAKAGYESPSGTMVLSRHPAALVQTLPTGMGQHVIRIHRPAGELTLVAAHPSNMLPGVDTWLRDAETLTEAVVPLVDQGPLVVAGDLNAVPEHATYRRLLQRTGLRDAAQQAGTGWRPTFPANDVVPPLLAIDHVLVNDRVSAQVVRTFHVDGTDHLGLYAELSVS